MHFAPFWKKKFLKDTGRLKSVLGQISFTSVPLLYQNVRNTIWRHILSTRHTSEAPVYFCTESNTLSCLLDEPFLIISDLKNLKDKHYIENLFILLYNIYVLISSKKVTSLKANTIWARSCENVSYAICEQQRRRSACASAQSDQHLCCSLLR